MYGREDPGRSIHYSDYKHLSLDWGIDTKMNTRSPCAFKVLGADRVVSCDVLGERAQLRRETGREMLICSDGQMAVSCDLLCNKHV